MAAEFFVFSHNLLFLGIKKVPNLSRSATEFGLGEVWQACWMWMEIEYLCRISFEKLRLNKLAL